MEKDRLGIYVMLIVLATTFALISAFGSLSSFAGWGGGVAFLIFASFGAYLYTSRNQAQLYYKMLAISEVLGVLGVILNVFWPFGSALYNFTVSNDIVASLSGLMGISLFLILYWIGIRNTKHRDMY